MTQLDVYKTGNIISLEVPESYYRNSNRVTRRKTDNVAVVWTNSVNVDCRSFIVVLLFLQSYDKKVDLTDALISDVRRLCEDVEDQHLTDPDCVIARCQLHHVVTAIHKSHHPFLVCRHNYSESLLHVGTGSIICNVLCPTIGTNRRRLWAVSHEVL